MKLARMQLQQLLLSVLVLSLAACGGSGSEQPTPPPPPPPVGVTDFSVNVAEPALVSGDSVNVTLSLSRVPDAELKLQVEWLNETDQTVFSHQDIVLNPGSASVTTDLTVPQLSNERYDLVASSQIKISLNASAVVSDSLTVYAAAPADKLLNSNGFKWATAKQAELIWYQGMFEVIGTEFELWPIPDDPTWHEDPFDNNTWLLYYHALGWLYALDHAYATSGDEAILERIEFLLLDYLRDNPRDSDTNYMAWNDHAVAWRLEALTYFYQKYFRSRWSATEKAEGRAYLLDHADELQLLLDDDRYFAHNHSMYHAMSLYNFSFVFPRENEQKTYREDAVQRINDLFDEMVNNETGISVEQSTSYHFIAMELFIDANRLAQNMTAQPMATLADNLAKMADFAAHLIYRNGLSTALGDTNYGYTIWWERLTNIVERGGIESAYVNYVLSDGEGGRPLEANYVAASDGYVIQRPAYSNESDEIYTFTDFGKKLFSHGHHDAGNVVVAINGEQILIDSGGPYLYNSPKRAHFRSAYAHNTLMVNEQAAFFNDADVLNADCEGELCYSLGKISEANYDHWRLVVTVKTEQGPRWVIADLARPEASANNFKLIYHIAESAQVDLQDESTACQAVTLASGKQLCLQVSANIPQEVRYYAGVDDGDYTQGWVQPAFGQRLPAPTLEFISNGQYLNAITELRSDANAAEPMAELNAIDEDTLTYTVELGSHTLLLSDLASIRPSVSVSANN